MNTFFAKMTLIVGVFCTFSTINAQIIWPKTDTVSMRASQFADASTIRFVRKDTVYNFSLNSFKGWITIGIDAANSAKADSAVFQWSPDGTGKQGAFWKTRAPITSLNTSRGSGAAIFNSDYLDNRGVPTNTGGGQAPAPHFGELWSPIIDATGFNDMSVLFQSYYRHFQSDVTNPFWASTYVSWSEDGGVSWKGRIPIEDHEGYGTYDETPNGNEMVIKFPKSKGTAKFRFKFVFNGYFYFWLIDDVRLGVVKNNMRINPNSVAIPPVQMGINNVDSVRFMANIANNGTITARNVKLTAKVFNATTKAEVFSTTGIYGAIAPDSVAQNRLLPQAFLPANTSGATYDIRYEITHDSLDEFRKDDTLRFNTALRVTDSLFRHDNVSDVIDIAPNAPTWQAGQIKSWRVGQYFYMPTNSLSLATATRISAVLDDRFLTSSRLYTVGLYEWIDRNADDSVQLSERTLVATGQTTLTSDPLGAVIDFKLDNTVQSGKPIVLKRNQAYLAMLDLIPTRTVDRAWLATADDRGRLGSIGMKTATKLAGKSRYAGIINYNTNDASAAWETNLFGDDLGRYSPKIRLWSWAVVTKTDDLPADYKVNIYPNPVGQNLSINLDFPKSEDAILCRVFDLKGQLIQEKECLNVQKETVTMDVNSLGIGSYLLQIQTLTHQTKTVKFVKTN
jgi:Secretion system C-terminal sorting domain